MVNTIPNTNLISIYISIDIFVFLGLYMILDIIINRCRKQHGGHEENNEEFDDDVVIPQNGGGMAIHMVIALIALVMAVVLSWRCNTMAGESMGMKILYAVIAALFNYIYLIYYFVYHVLMGNSCGV